MGTPLQVVRRGGLTGVPKWGHNKNMNTTPNRYGNLDQAVAAEVRAELARQNRTIKGLSEALNMHRTNTSTRVNGHIPFTVGELFNTAEYLGTTAEALTEAAQRQMVKQEEAA